jgi:hypothetical protein
VDLVINSTGRPAADVLLKDWHCRSEQWRSVSISALQSKQREKHSRRVYFAASRKDWKYDSLYNSSWRLDQSTCDWIKAHTDRINFLLPEFYGKPLLSRLELFLQNPVYEGMVSHV